MQEELEETRITRKDTREDARTTIQAALGPVLLLAETLAELDSGHPRGGEWDYYIPHTVARLATQARAHLVEQEPKEADLAEEEFHRAEAILSSIAALACLIDHDGVFLGGGTSNTPELYRASRGELQADLAMLCRMARSLWDVSVQVEEVAHV